MIAKTKKDAATIGAMAFHIKLDLSKQNKPIKNENPFRPLILKGFVYYKKRLKHSQLKKSSGNFNLKNTVHHAAKHHQR